MRGNRVWRLVAVLLLILVLLWLLRVALKLIFVGLVVVAAIAAFQVVRKRIGRPRAR